MALFVGSEEDGVIRSKAQLVGPEGVFQRLALRIRWLHTRGKLPSSCFRVVLGPDVPRFNRYLCWNCWCESTTLALPKSMA